MSSQSASSYHNQPGEKGRKLLKTNVKVLGKFLLSPGDPFNAMVARQMIDKARGNGISMSTEFKVFEHGVQLGQRAALVGMPIEFIKYHRLSGMTSLTNESSTLVFCIRDYDQQCVIVMRLKDAVSLKVVMDVIHKRQAVYANGGNLVNSQQQGSTVTSRRVYNSPSALQTNDGGAASVIPEPDGGRDHTDAPMMMSSRAQREMAPTHRVQQAVQQPETTTKHTSNGEIREQQHHSIVRSRPLLTAAEQGKIMSTSSTTALQLHTSDGNGNQLRRQQQQEVQHQQMQSRLPRTRVEWISGVGGGGTVDHRLQDYDDSVDETRSEVLFSAGRYARPIARVTDNRRWIADNLRQRGTGRLIRTSVRP